MSGKREYLPHIHYQKKKQMEVPVWEPAITIYAKKSKRGKESVRLEFIPFIQLSSSKELVRAKYLIERALSMVKDLMS